MARLLWHIMKCRLIMIPMLVLPYLMPGLTTALASATVSRVLGTGPSSRQQMVAAAKPRTCRSSSKIDVSPLHKCAIVHEYWH